MRFSAEPSRPQSPAIVILTTDCITTCQLIWVWSSQPKTSALLEGGGGARRARWSLSLLLAVLWSGGLLFRELRLKKNLMNDNEMGREADKRSSKSRARKKDADWTADQDSRFLTELAKRGIIQNAINAAGVTRSAADYRRSQDANFAAACKEAIEASNDVLMNALWDRGIDGVEQTYPRPGGVTVKTRKFDTPAVQLLMRERYPHLFSRLELTGKDGRDIKIKVVE